MKDIVILGAGPVGLKTAIEIKLRDPNLNIAIVERYPEYKRKHILNIAKSAFKNSYPHDTYQTLLQSFVGNVSTQVIEEKLKQFTKELGVQFLYKKIESPEVLATLFSESKLIIAADGAHSLIRKNIFGDHLKNKSDLQFVAEMKYVVQGKTRSFSTFTEAPRVLLKTHHLVVEHVGKTTENNETPISLRIFVSPTEYKSIQNASFKTPYHWTPVDKQKIAPTLLDTMEIWLAERTRTLHDQIKPNSIKISGLKLGTYSSQTVVKKAHGTTWALVGDAAFGVPYFRSLNNGFLCADVLADKSVRFMRDDFDITTKKLFGMVLWKKSASPLKAYETFVDELSDYENFIAVVKAKGIETLGHQLNGARMVAGLTEKVETKHMMLASAGMLMAYGMKKIYDRTQAQGEKTSNEAQASSVERSYWKYPTPQKKPT